jgi:hypothetical protein
LDDKVNIEKGESIMSTELYRKYIDIINENSVEPQVLEEGMLNDLMAKVKGNVANVQKMLGDKLEAVKAAALKATGGDKSFTLDNIKKVAGVLKQMGLDKQVAESSELDEGTLGKLAAAGSTALGGALLAGWSLPVILLAATIVYMIA